MRAAAEILSDIDLTIVGARESIAAAKRELEELKQLIARLRVEGRCLDLIGGKS
jgi:hypothetical protein